MNESNKVDNLEKFYDDEENAIEEQDEITTDEEVQALLENNKVEVLKDEVNEIFDGLDNSKNVTKTYISEKTQSVDTILVILMINHNQFLPKGLVNISTDLL